MKNADLWRDLDAACARHQVKWGWLKGHAGHVDNERCDVLAGASIQAIRQKHSPAELKAALAAFKESVETKRDDAPTLF